MLVSIMVSSLFGLLSGLGVGGGSLLMLWLTLVCGMRFDTAKCINLLFFLPAASISCFSQRKKLFQNTRYIIAAVVAGCACSAIAAYFSQFWNISQLKKLYGILLLFAAIHEFRISFK